MSQDYRVVTQDIPVGQPGSGVFAARAGDKLPAETVKANGWENYVASPQTKAAQKAVAEATGEGA